MYAYTRVGNFPKRYGRGKRAAISGTCVGYNIGIGNWERYMLQEIIR
jgi:hypothetical protein